MENCLKAERSGRLEMRGLTSSWRSLTTLHYSSAGVLLYLEPGSLLGSNGVLRGEKLLELRYQIPSPGPEQQNRALTLTGAVTLRGVQFVE